MRKELEEERQLQELQRLQEEQTGKKRSEKLEWMYSTPATGSGATTNDLEDYLLGKKRVDKILIGDENAKVSQHSFSFECVINAPHLDWRFSQELYRCPEREYPTRYCSQSS